MPGLGLEGSQSRRGKAALAKTCCHSIPEAQGSLTKDSGYQPNIEPMTHDYHMTLIGSSLQALGRPTSPRP